MSRPTSEIERSFSIEENSAYDSECEFLRNEKWQKSGESLEPDVSRLKAQNTARLHQRWEEIIAKYSAIDDNKESDEIDLFTGRITIDNGHLSSILKDETGTNRNELPSNIWALDDDSDREKIEKIEKRERRKKMNAERLQKKLKCEERERIDSRHLFNKPVLSLDTNIASLEDNLSLLKPSPKKQKTSWCTQKLISPSKFGPCTLSYGPRLSTPDSSPLKRALKEDFPSVIASPSASVSGSPKKGSLNSSGTPRNSKSSKNILPEKLRCPDKVIPEILRSPRKVLPDIKGNDLPNHQRNFLTEKNRQSLPESPRQVLRRRPNLSSPETNDILKISDSDTSFSITELFEPIQFAFFSCAFYGCKYSSTSKGSYRAHLLSQHSPELQQIGYPVKSEKKYSHSILGDTIPKLNVHFPLVFGELPGRPYFCGSQIGHERCQKLFINKKILIQHKQKIPADCSTKKQVLVCPLLGCEFMTDVSYDEFRAHIETHRKTRSLVPFEVSTLVQPISDYFNDSLSSVFSTDEEDVEDILVKKNVVKNTENPIINKLQNPIVDNLPSLEILDCDSELDHTMNGNDSGFTSLDELFQD